METIKVRKTTNKMMMALRSQSSQKQKLLSMNLAKRLKNLSKNIRWYLRCWKIDHTHTQDQLNVDHNSNKQMKTLITTLMTLVIH